MQKPGNFDCNFQLEIPGLLPSRKSRIRTIKFHEGSHLISDQMKEVSHQSDQISRISIKSHQLSERLPISHQNAAFKKVFFVKFLL
jgi:hypothetical protein